MKGIVCLNRLTAGLAKAWWDKTGSISEYNSVVGKELLAEEKGAQSLL
jgi:hypothetical protein